MFYRSIIAAALVAGLVAGLCAPAWAASECLKDLTTLDQRYALGVTKQADAPPRPAASPPAAQAAGAPTNPPPAPGPNSQLDTVPNTGGVVDRPPDQLQPLPGGMRNQVASLLQEAKKADEAGDGTTCADRLRQARQLAQEAPGTPSDMR